MSKSYEMTDLRFAGFIVPPSETFADTMRLEFGWCTPGSEQQEKAPYLHVADGVEEHIDAMQAFVAMTVQYFGLNGVPPTEDKVREFVEDHENKCAVGVYTFPEEIINVSLRYLRGEGDNYRLLGELANRDNFEIMVSR